MTACHMSKPMHAVPTPARGQLHAIRTDNSGVIATRCVRTTTSTRTHAKYEDRALTQPFFPRRLFREGFVKCATMQYMDTSPPADSLPPMRCVRSGCTRPETECVVRKETQSFKNAATC
eukprot:NODE_4026_length_1946_cov_7.210005.p2 GENE.NODE_4026_length_1946_cov_7.210005~~NODE_4026_length_1946_cov_7.210005.p2  ORF type:complete len:119 (-),score=1.93 NODE_4026_length_1946_cov_7.210005:216-572(-)